MNITQATTRMTIIPQASANFPGRVFASFCAAVTGRWREEDEENRRPDGVGGH